jgi:hypothetical protein
MPQKKHRNHGKKHGGKGKGKAHFKVGLQWPPRMTKTLKYQVTSAVINDPSTHFINNRLSMSYLPKIDPTLSSTPLQDYNIFEQIYRFYRVLAARIVIDFENQEAFPVTIFCTPSNTDPGSNSSTYTNALADRRCKIKNLGPLTGEGKGRISYTLTTDKIAGAHWTDNPDFYTAATAYSGSTPPAAPPNQWYYWFGVETNVVMVSGVFINYTVYLETCFFELTQQSPTTFSMRFIPERTEHEDIQLAIRTEALQEMGRKQYEAKFPQFLKRPCGCSIHDPPCFSQKGVIRSLEYQSCVGFQDKETTVVQSGETALTVVPAPSVPLEGLGSEETLRQKAYRFWCLAYGSTFDRHALAAKLRGVEYLYTLGDTDEKEQMMMMLFNLECPEDDQGLRHFIYTLQMLLQKQQDSGRTIVQV